MGINARNGDRPIVLSQQEAYECCTFTYKFAQSKGIPFDKRISPYFLSPACSQLNHGMYVADNGLIKSCPGQPLTARDLQECKFEASIGRFQVSGDLTSAWKSNPSREVVSLISAFLDAEKLTLKILRKELKMLS